MNIQKCIELLKVRLEEMKMSPMLTHCDLNFDDDEIEALEFAIKEMEKLK